MNQTVPLKKRTEGLGEFEPNDVIPIEHGGTGASTLLEAQDQLGISGKLDKIDFVQHFRGVFSSYSALMTALPTALDGDYAHIDSGAGFDRLAAVWDSSDTKWAIAQANVGANTDEVPEGNQNLYFKSQRVLDTPLTGLAVVPAHGILATDEILMALAKLQAQINANSIKPVNWIDVRTIATFNNKVYLPGVTLKIANINGEFWMKGSFQVTAQISANTDPIFTINNKDWFVFTSAEAANVGLVQTFNTYGSTLTAYIFGFIQAPAINFSRFYCVQSTPSSAVFNFVPFHIGTLLNPAVGLV